MNNLIHCTGHDFYRYINQEAQVDVHICRHCGLKVKTETAANELSGKSC